MLRTSTIPKTFLCAALALSGCGDDGGAEATGDTTETGSGESGEASGTEATSSSSEASTEATTGDGDGDATGDGDGDATGDGDGDGTSGDGDGDGLVNFRMDTVVVQDPHFYADVLGSCLDITHPGGLIAVNDLISDAIEMDGDDPADDLYDLSLIYGLNPGNSSVASGVSEAGLAECNVDDSPCIWGAFGAPEAGVFTNETSGECVSVAELDADYGPINTPGNTCFTTTFDSFTLNLGGISVPLSDVTVAATWNGSTQTDGVLKGFLDETTAGATDLPDSIPLFGGMPITALLAGGAACQVDAANPIDEIGRASCRERV